MKKNGPLYAIVVLSVAALIILIIHYGRNIESYTPAVILPSTVVSGGLEQDQDGINSHVQRVEVNTKVVQAVLAELSRADNYYRYIEIENFFEGGSSKSNLQVWVKGDSMRITETDTNQVKNVLILGDDVWIWYEDGGKAYKGSLSKGDGDRYQHLLTYEDMLDVEPEQIKDAGYTTYAELPCIYAEYEAGKLGYIYRIYVSVESGLLMGAEIYDGNSAIYRMISQLPDISTPSDEVFVSP